MQRTFAVTFVLGKSFSGRSENFFSPVPLKARMPVNYVLRLATRQRPNKVGVMIGMDSHAWEKQVLFIGSRWCAHSCRGLRLVEGRHHRSERKLLMPGVFCGHGWPRRREGEGEGRGWGGGGRVEGAAERTDHLDHGPQRLAWQSQSEQQWTEDSQSADFPSLAFSLAAFQQTHAVQQDFQKGDWAWFFSTELRPTVSLCPAI